MAVYGNLASMPVSELLQWLGGNGKTGLLRVEREGVATKLFFEEGRIVACISNEPRHLLGQFLLFRGAITESDLREAMSVQDSTGRGLPDILVERGAISSVRLEAEVVVKAQETILALFEWDEATFWYRESMTAEDKAVRVNLEVQGLLLEGMKRLDELAQLRKVFPDPGMVPRPGDQLPSPGGLDDSAAQAVYQAVNGKRTLAEIQLFVHGTEFQVYRRLLRLCELGLIEVARAELPDVEPGAELVPFESGLSTADPSPPVDSVQPLEVQPETEGEAESLRREEAPGFDDLDLDLESLVTEEPRAPGDAEPERLEDLVLEPGPIEPPPLESLVLEDEVAEAPPGETTVLEAAAADGPSVDAPVLELDPPGEDAELPEPEEIDLGGDLEKVVAAGVEEPAAGIELENAEPDFEEVHAAVESHLQIAREHLSQSEPEAALDELAQASQVGAGHPSIGAMRAQSEAAMLQRYLREGIHPERCPVVVATAEQLEQAETSAAQDYLLGLADGTWDVRSILSVSPLRPLEVMRALSGLLMRGLIELREAAASGATAPAAVRGGASG